MTMQGVTQFEQSFHNLPPRRREVLLKLLVGQTDDQIAEAMGIHAGTVRKQISTLCDDFHLKDASDERRSKRADLIALVAQYKPEWLKTDSTSSKSNQSENTAPSKFPTDFLEQLASEKELTNREKEVFLKIFGEYKSRIEIAQQLHVSQSAVATSLAGIYRKFQISSSGPVKQNRLLSYLINQYQQLLQTENPEHLTTLASPEPSLPSHPFSPLSGSIENPQYLFDREHEIRRIFELLNSGSSVALIGEEAIGKSSILKAVFSQAETHLNSSRNPIYLDLGHVCNEEDFYFAFCDQVGIKEQKGYRLSKALKNYRLLLILDNVEKMAWNGFTNQVRSQLRALATDGNPPLRLVVAARTPLSQLFSDSGMVSPFENICQEETINRWDEQACFDFIVSRLEPTSIQFSEAEMTELIHKSRGHPQQLMKLCYECYNSYQKS